MLFSPLEQLDDHPLFIKYKALLELEEGVRKEAAPKGGASAHHNGHNP
jgi:hypothetical protein